MNVWAVVKIRLQHLQSTYYMFPNNGKLSHVYHICAYRPIVRRRLLKTTLRGALEEGGVGCHCGVTGRDDAISSDEARYARQAERRRKYRGNQLYKDTIYLLPLSRNVQVETPFPRGVRTRIRETEGGDNDPSTHHLVVSDGKFEATNLLRGGFLEGERDSMDATVSYDIFHLDQPLALVYMASWSKSS